MGEVRMVTVDIGLNLVIEKNDGETGWWVKLGGSTYRLRRTEVANKEGGTEVRWDVTLWRTGPRGEVGELQESLRSAIMACVEHHIGPCGTCRVAV